MFRASQLIPLAWPAPPRRLQLSHACFAIVWMMKTHHHLSVLPSHNNNNNNNNSSSNSNNNNADDLLAVSVLLLQQDSNGDNGGNGLLCKGMRRPTSPRQQQPRQLYGFLMRQSGRLPSSSSCFYSFPSCAATPLHNLLRTGFQSGIVGLSFAILIGASTSVRAPRSSSSSIRSSIDWEEDACTLNLFVPAAPRVFDTGSGRA